jgi:hypothetical protein
MSAGCAAGEVRRHVLLQGERKAHTSIVAQTRISTINGQRPVKPMVGRSKGVYHQPHADPRGSFAQ